MTRVAGQAVTVKLLIDEAGGGDDEVDVEFDVEVLQEADEDLGPTDEVEACEDMHYLLREGVERW